MRTIVTPPSKWSDYGPRESRNFRRLLTFRENLDTVVASYILGKIAKAGLTFETIKNAFEKANTKGVVTLLAGSPNPVTKNVPILAKTVLFFKNEQ